MLETLTEGGPRTDARLGQGGGLPRVGLPDLWKRSSRLGFHGAQKKKPKVARKGGPVRGWGL